ncbi:MAG: GAF domain-containing protein [Anaeromyxobacter sp.]
MIDSSQDDEGLVAQLRRRLRQAEADADAARRALAAADQRSSWAMTLFAVSWRLHQARTAAALFAALDEVAAEVLDGRALAVYLREPGGSGLRLAHAGRGPGLPASAVLGEGLVGRAAAEGRTQHAPAAGDGPCLAIPLGAPPRVLGALAVHDPARAGPLDADRTELLQVVARIAAHQLPELLPLPTHP